MKDGDPKNWRDQNVLDFEKFDFSSKLQTLEDIKKSKIGKYDTPEKENANGKRAISDDLPTIDENIDFEGKVSIKLN